MKRLSENYKGNIDHIWLNKHYGHIGSTYPTESAARYVLLKSTRKGWVYPVYDGIPEERKIKCWLVSYA